MAKHGLGRGLGALFGDIDLNEDAAEEQNVAKEIPIADIHPNENQPRKKFDDAAMLELANSIRLHGVISPVILVKRGADDYMLIAGERRWRAAKKAGLTTMPAIVRDYTDQQIKEISLIENLQREDLNPIEVATAVKQLMDEYSYTQEQVADRIGKSRPAVANLLRLLTLSPAVIDLVATGKLTEGHARCLVAIHDPDKQLEIAKKAMNDKLTVRDFEKLVKRLTTPWLTSPSRPRSRSSSRIWWSACNACSPQKCRSTATTAKAVYTSTTSRPMTSTAFTICSKSSSITNRNTKRTLKRSLTRPEVSSGLFFCLNDRPFI